MTDDEPTLQDVRTTLVNARANLVREGDHMEKSWWNGPWVCKGCNFTADGYDVAEMHKRRTGHGLENRKGSR